MIPFLRGLTRKAFFIVGAIAAGLLSSLPGTNIGNGALSATLGQGCSTQGRVQLSATASEGVLLCTGGTFKSMSNGGGSTAQTPGPFTFSALSYAGSGIMIEVHAVGVSRSAQSWLAGAGYAELGGGRGRSDPEVP